MGYRQEILTQLYKILEKSTTDARVYYRLADKCNRSSLKFFLKKLSFQKRIFIRRLRYEIGELKKEIEIIGGDEYSPKNFTSSQSLSESPVLSTDVQVLISYCEERERQYIDLYKNLLSRTNLGNIREMLLSQKHIVQQVVNDIKTLENKIYKSNNEEEFNYS